MIGRIRESVHGDLQCGEADRVQQEAHQVAGQFDEVTTEGSGVHVLDPLRARHDAVGEEGVAIWPAQVDRGLADPGSASDSVIVNPADPRARYSSIAASRIRFSTPGSRGRPGGRVLPGAASCPRDSLIVSMRALPSDWCRGGAPKIIPTMLSVLHGMSV